MSLGLGLGLGLFPALEVFRVFSSFSPLRFPFSMADSAAAAQWDDATGAPLNDAARSILEEAKATIAKSSAASSKSSSKAFISEDAARAILAAIPDVDLATGEHKYVQVIVSVKGAPKGVSKPIVTSTAGLMYHPDMYDAAMKKLKPLGITGRVVGGGRINLDHGAKTASVWGYSKSFGRAEGCNKRSAEIIGRFHPDYRVTWSDDGY